MLTQIADSQQLELLSDTSLVTPVRTSTDTRLTITEQFVAFDQENPWVYSTLERLVSERLATGASRIGVKALFEALRWQLPHGISGLNNNFTSLYARKLIEHHPGWASVFELRRRRTA
ncbi:hypothetical protein [Streptomyces yaizuensis]|uniref:Uncharacterized protein n=1 Tax=Streptomyces yaizuensis TaxID=2989713 RepID=A0ABQ5P615_9ACTN|nr:hypothetical protein [Streptomyces sp. YSPA8]GLF98042.1 hypothetical protein SYYSPA8_27115 [Streptomyces sp. YSPA8]